MGVRRWWILWAAVVVLILGGWTASRWRRLDRERRYDRLIGAAAARYAVDPALVRAVVWRESRFRADARGSAGEIGLMQLREVAAGECAAAERVTGFDHEQVADPTTNLLAGTWYLAKLLRRYGDTDQPEVYALADYNAGRSRVLRWAKEAGKTNAAVFMEQVGFPGTRRYVEQVLAQRHRYVRGQ